MNIVSKFVIISFISGSTLFSMEPQPLKRKGDHLEQEETKKQKRLNEAPLRKAIKDKDINKLKKLLENAHKQLINKEELKSKLGGLISYIIDMKYGLAFLADRTHLDTMCELLLKHGADPDALSKHKKEPLLIQAITRGAYRDSVELGNIVKALLSHGANPTCLFSKPSTALNFAALHGIENMAHMLLQQGVNPNFNCYKFPLEEAIPKHFALVKLLLERGANPTWQNINSMASRNSLRNLLLHKNIKTLSLLFKHGVKTNQQILYALTNYFEFLLDFLSEHNTSTYELMLIYGAYKNTNPSNIQLLYSSLPLLSRHAINENFKALEEYLTQNQYTNPELDRALQLAVGFGQLENVKILLKAGASPRKSLVSLTGILMQQEPEKKELYTALFHYLASLLDDCDSSKDLLAKLCSRTVKYANYNLLNLFIAHRAPLEPALALCDQVIAQQDKETERKKFYDIREYLTKRASLCQQIMRRFPACVKSSIAYMPNLKEGFEKHEHWQTITQRKRDEQLKKG